MGLSWHLRPRGLTDHPSKGFKHFLGSSRILFWARV